MKPYPSFARFTPLLILFGLFAGLLAVPYQSVAQDAPIGVARRTYRAGLFGGV